MDNLLRLLIQLFFILLDFIIALDYLRYKGIIRRDTALMVGALALIYILLNLTKAFSLELKRANTLASISLVTQPYLLLRLIQYFHLTSPTLILLTFIGMIISWIALLLADTFSGILQVITFLALIASFIAVDSYAMYIFRQMARTSLEVVRQRMIFVAIGSGFLAATLLGLALTALIPLLQDLFVVLAAATAIGSAFSYYLGFIPPRWFRRAWQFVELRAFLLHQSSKAINERLSPAESLQETHH